MTKDILRWYRNCPAAFAYCESEEQALQEIKTVIDVGFQPPGTWVGKSKKPQSREVLL
jgi:hypothetical protein